ncbi:MAG: hypothetical protein ABIO05_01600, partial [Ferruginibacter sp.]
MRKIFHGRMRCMLLTLRAKDFLNPMRFFPASTLQQLEFDKIKMLLSSHCKSTYAKSKAEVLRIHTKKEFILKELNQSNEFKILLDSGQFFPNDFFININKEIKLLSITGASLSGEQFLLLKRLADNTAG